MEIPIYFNIEYFKKDYLKDFKEIRKSNPDLNLIEYYNLIRKTYFNLHADLSRIDMNEELLIELLCGLYKNGEFIRFLYDEYFDDINYIFDNLGLTGRKRHLSYEIFVEVIKELVANEINNIDGKIAFISAEIQEFILNEVYKIEFQINPKKNTYKGKLSNPKKLAFLQVIGFFDLPIMQNLSEDKQNEIVSLLLDADKKEFVYKNRLNLNSIDPTYQTDKYTAYQHIGEMEKILNEMQ